MSAICDAYKKVDAELLYNSVHRKFNQLEKRCGRENQYPQALIEQLEIRPVWEKILEWGPCPREAEPPVEQPRRTGKKRCYGHKSRGQYVAVLFGLQLPLTQ